MCSSPRIRARHLAAAAAGGLALAVIGNPSPAFAGPVNVVSQDRSVHVAIPSIVEGEPAVDETVSAPDNAAFTQTLDRTLNQLGQVNHSFASQDSSFGNASDDVFNVSANGQTRYSATGLSGIVFAESDFQVQFTLDAPRDYTISGTGSFVDTGGGASAFLVTLTGPGGTVASFAKSDFDPGNLDGSVVNPNFGTNGTLEAGTYTLFATSGVSGGTNSSEIQASFDIDFSATAGDAVPIPLPAGVWPGAAMLGGMGAVALRKRRRLVH